MAVARRAPARRAGTGAGVPAKNTARQRTVPVPGMRAPRLLPATVTLDGRPLTFPDVPHATVWTWLGEGRWVALLSGLPPDDIAWLDERLADPDDVFDQPDVARLCQRVLAATTGLPWWAAHRLASVAITEQVWFAAWCAGKNIDPWQAPPYRLAAAVVAWVYAGTDDVAALDRALWIPPPHVPRWDARHEAATFAAAQASSAARRLR